MACGLPVIATEATGIRELITDGVEGFVVPAPPDADPLAGAIETLLSDSDRAQAMGAAGGAESSPLGAGIVTAANSSRLVAVRGPLGCGKQANGEFVGDSTYVRGQTGSSLFGLPPRLARTGHCCQWLRSRAA